MLTGDENIVDVNFTVFWVIKDARSYLFNIRGPEATVKSAAESAMREVVGETPIAQALSEGRGKIETDTQGLLQGILNAYGAGIEVTQLQLLKVDPPAPVIDAFRDVQRALADRERLRNEAESYRNDIIPRARGDAVRIKQEADAYRQEIMARAQGDADRFLSVYNAFKVSQDVTIQRLYLETMEEVLKNSNKVIIDKIRRRRDRGPSRTFRCLRSAVMEPRAARRGQYRREQLGARVGGLGWGGAADARRPALAASVRRPS